MTEAIYSLVSEGDISPEKGAQKLGISVEQLKAHGLTGCLNCKKQADLLKT